MRTRPTPTPASLLLAGTGPLQCARSVCSMLFLCPACKMASFLLSVHPYGCSPPHDEHAGIHPPPTSSPRPPKPRASHSLAASLPTPARPVPAGSATQKEIPLSAEPWLFKIYLCILWSGSGAQSSLSGDHDARPATPALSFTDQEATRPHQIKCAWPPQALGVMIQQMPLNNLLLKSTLLKGNPKDLKVPPFCKPDRIKHSTQASILLKQLVLSSETRFHKFCTCQPYKEEAKRREIFHAFLRSLLQWWLELQALLQVIALSPSHQKQYLTWTPLLHSHAALSIHTRSHNRSSITCVPGPGKPMGS